MSIRKSDVKTEHYSGSGPGGQYRNRHANCIRMTHLPTGIVVHASSERSQDQNLRAAWKVLASRLGALRDERVAVYRKAAWSGKPDAAFGNQIRSYRLHGAPIEVVDHRTGGRYSVDVLWDARKTDAMIKGVQRCLASTQAGS